MASYVPLAHVAIRIAAVVDETGTSTALGRINVLVTLQHHKVKVHEVLLFVLRHAPHKRIVRDDLANVLKHKLITLDVRTRAYAKAFFRRLDNVDVCVRMPLEALVRTVLTTSAHIAQTLDLREPIDAA